MVATNSRAIFTTFAMWTATLFHPQIPHDKGHFETEMTNIILNRISLPAKGVFDFAIAAICVSKRKIKKKSKICQP